MRRNRHPFQRPDSCQKQTAAPYIFFRHANVPEKNIQLSLLAGRGGEGKGQGRVGKGGRRGEGGRSEEVMDGREREKEMITKGKTRERKGMGWTQGERRGRERGDGELIVMEDKVKGDGEGGHRRKSWR